jgi:predicted 2-oxoglutarate/Fe(II)-dependent dioxygenase YbiX
MLPRTIFGRSILTPEECKILSDFGSSRCEKSVVESEEKLFEVTDHRKSVNTFFERGEDPVIDKILTVVIRSYLEACAQHLLFPINQIESPQYAEYKEGMYYHYHWDCIDDPSLDRDVSASLFLSNPNDYEGGQLEFENIDNGKSFKVEENQGDMIIFPSLFRHRVNAVTKGVRRSLVIWGRR